MVVLRTLYYEHLDINPMSFVDLFEFLCVTKKLYKAHFFVFMEILTRALNTLHVYMRE